MTNTNNTNNLLSILRSLLYILDMDTCEVRTDEDYSCVMFDVPVGSRWVVTLSDFGGEVRVWASDFGYDDEERAVLEIEARTAPEILDSLGKY